MRSAGASSLMTLRDFHMDKSIVQSEASACAACSPRYVSFNPCFNDRHALW